MPIFQLFSGEIEKDVIGPNINKNHLPKILVRDPISRYYGAKSGDIFKVIRPSSASGEYITFRLVK
jgi:DNA-directed RNA polymerase I, II, and III subunit RPABC1